MQKLGELLVEAGVISEEHLAFALNVQRQRGGRLGWHLVELGFVSESALAKTLSKQLRLPAVSAAAIERVPREVIAMLPLDSAMHHRAVPVRREGNQLWVAMADPTDQRVIAELDAATGLTVRPMVASDLLITYALEKHYGVQPQRRPGGVGVSPALDLRIEPSRVTPGALVGIPAPAAAPVAAAGAVGALGGASPSATNPGFAAPPSSPNLRPTVPASSPNLRAPVPASSPNLSGAAAAISGTATTTISTMASLGRAVAAAGPPVAPVPFPDRYSPERAALESMVQDLDERAPVARMGLATLGSRLAVAPTERAVFDIVTAFLSQDFERTVVLLLRNGRLAGFCAQGFLISEAALLNFSASLQEIPVLARVVSDGQTRLGRASSQTLGPLVHVVGQPGERAVLLMPVRCAGEAVALVVSIGGRSGVESYVDEYIATAAKTDMALQMVVLRKRITE